VKGLRHLRIVIEKFYDDDQNEIGELVIESDSFGFQVIHYSASFRKDKGVVTDQHLVISTAHYLSVAGCIKNVLNRKIKESTATDLKELRADFLRIEAWIHELIEF
jgi:predicted proteasome-type protease